LYAADLGLPNLGRTQLPVWLMAFGLGLCSVDTQVRLPGARSQPTYRANVNLVTLNVRVLDGRGQFVRGLAPTDFQVSEDGVPQTVSTLAFVDIPIPPRASNAPAASPRSRPAEEDAPVGGRTYVFLVDDLHIAWEHVDRTKDFLRRFVREDFAPGDRAALIFTSSPLSRAFTTQPERLIEAIGRFQFPARWRSALRPWQHPSLSAVSTVSAWLGSMPGKKALIFVSEYVGCRLIDPDPKRGNGGYIGDEDLCRFDLAKATNDAVRANASIYTIDPRGLIPTAAGAAEHASGVGGVRQLAQVNATEMVRQQPLRALADDTDGFALVGSNSFDAAFDRIVRENSTYYVIGYYSSNPTTVTKRTVHKNKIKISRRGVTAYYRGQYAVAPDSRPKR
jgi:VWFA-related protein